MDVVFEEDVGFLGALRDLRRGAKCPVVLTAESYRHEYAPLACNIWYLPRPRLVEVFTYLEECDFVMNKRTEKTKKNFVLQQYVGKSETESPHM